MRSSINIHDISLVTTTAFNAGDTPSLTVRAIDLEGNSTNITLLFTGRDQAEAMATAVYSSVVLQGEKAIAHS